MTVRPWLGRDLHLHLHERAGLDLAVGVGDRGAELGGPRVGIDRLVDVIDLGVDLASRRRGR